MKRLFTAFEEAGRELYLVGGAVRDLIMGIPPERLDDLDFATSATPDESLRILREAGFHTHAVGKAFGTVGALLQGDEAEGYPKDCQITTYRSGEVYDRGSRHPEVTFGDSIEDDLWRRDLSINSIAMTGDGAFFDPYGGRRDIESGVLRAVGDPMERLREDPLRSLRVARFVAKLGFSPDPALTAATRAHADALLEISRERWLAEIDKLLIAPHAVDGLRFLAATGLMNRILPEVEALRGFHQSCEVHHKDLWEHTLGVVASTSPDRVLRWTALLHDIGKVDTRRVDDGGRVSFHGHEARSAEQFAAIAARFRLDREAQRAVARTIELHGLVPSYSADWSDSAVRRLANRAGDELEGLLAFARADLTTADPARRASALASVDHLEQRLAALEAADALRPRLPSGLGRAIMSELGLEPGPAVGAHVRRITEAAYDGLLPTAPTVEQCLAFLTSPSDRR